jgi:hypothetical protein
MPDLPRTLQEYNDAVERMLNRLEREIEGAFPTARRRLARMLRDASRELGRLEERGERAWKRSAGVATRESQRVLNQLSNTIEKLDLARGGKKKKKGAAKTSRKKAAKKKATRKKARAA